MQKSTPQFFEQYGYFGDMENEMRSIGNGRSDSKATMTANQIKHLKATLLQLVTLVEAQGKKQVGFGCDELSDARLALGDVSTIKRLIRADGSTKVLDGFGDFTDVQGLIGAEALDECEIDGGMQLWFDAQGKQKGKLLNEEATRLSNAMWVPEEQRPIYGDAVLTDAAEFMGE